MDLLAALVRDPVPQALRRLRDDHHHHHHHETLTCEPRALDYENSPFSVLENRGWTTRLHLLENRARVENANGRLQEVDAVDPSDKKENEESASLLTSDLPQLIP